MTLTKNNIITKISAHGFIKKKSTETIESLLEIIKHSLENDNDVLVSGFGKLCVKNKKQRRGRNPATGSELILGKRRVITFKCSTKLRKILNNNKK